MPLQLRRTLLRSLILSRFVFSSAALFLHVRQYRRRWSQLYLQLWRGLCRRRQATSLHGVQTRSRSSVIPMLRTLTGGSDRSARLAMLSRRIYRRGQGTGSWANPRLLSHPSLHRRSLSAVCTAGRVFVYASTWPRTRRVRIKFIVWFGTSPQCLIAWLAISSTTLSPARSTA